MTRRASSDRDPGNGVGIRALSAGNPQRLAPAAASIGEPSSYHAFLDGGPQMRAIGTVIENVADTDVTVLIRGESGVGKDVVARAIHAPSSPRGGPLHT